MHDMGIGDYTIETQSWLNTLELMVKDERFVPELKGWLIKEVEETKKLYSLLNLIREKENK